MVKTPMRRNVVQALLSFLKWIWVQICNHAAAIVLTALTTFFLTYCSLTETSTEISQTSWGEHCPLGLFREAQDSGMTLNFSAQEVKHMAVCGPGKSRGDSVANKVMSYLKTYQPDCFEVEEKKNGIVISPDIKNKNSKAFVALTPSGSRRFACRCDPDQFDLMLRKKSKICSLSTK